MSHLRAAGWRWRLLQEKWSRGVQITTHEFLMKTRLVDESKSGKGAKCPLTGSKIKLEHPAVGSTSGDRGWVSTWS